MNQTLKAENTKIENMPYRGRPKGWYTNRRGKHVPIYGGTCRRASRKSMQIATKLVLPEPIRTRLPRLVRKAVVGGILRCVLSQIPIINMLCTGYDVADAIYKNWNTIKQLVNVRTEDDLKAAASTIALNSVKGLASSAQSEIVWKSIADVVPEESQDVAKSILTDAMGQVTSSEIDFVSQFLARKKTASKKRSKAIRKRGDLSWGKPPESSKIPRGMDYV